MHDRVHDVVKSFRLLLHGACLQTAAERAENTLEGFKDLDLKAKARIWPRLDYLFHIRTTAVSSGG